MIELARDVVRWHMLHPLRATANLPLLTVQKDESIFASGDQSKSDIYTLHFQPTCQHHRDPARSSARRTAAAGGPGRVFYEGPPGDFFLSEFTLLADGKPCPLPVGHREFSLRHIGRQGHRRRSADRLVDQRRPGSGSLGRLPLREPLAVTRELKVKLLFERYYAAGLGRFRISVTTRPEPAQGR